MSGDLTPKQEKFCQKYIETGNASEAYRLAYDAKNMKSETINRNAFAQLEHSKISARIQFLKSKHMRRHDVTVDSITKEYEEIRFLATAKEQFAPAVSAITGKAKLHGLLVDKHELGSDPEHPIKIDVTLSPEEAYRRLLNGK